MKTTKRALFSSVVALILCFSMLVGTTFAWFTDEVKSDVNMIVAGNLDVDVVTTADDKSIENQSVLFDEIKLWEPGVVAYENITVKNLGTLALKYQLSVNFDKENYVVEADGTVTDKCLADVLKVAIVEETVSGSREEVLAKAGEGVLLSELVKSGKLESLKNQNYAIIIWWPQSTDDDTFNINNGKTTTDGEALHINLGLKVLATQLDADIEQDSFGPDYDEDAWHPEFQVYTAADLQAALNNGETNITLMDDIDATEPIVIPAAPTTYSLRTNAVVLNLNGKTINNPNGYAVENYGNVVITGNGTLTGLGGIRSHGGSVVIENGNFYASSRWQDGVYQHTLKAENTVVTINGGNFDATVNGQTNAMLNASENAVITINGGNFKNVAGDLTQFDPYIFTYEKNGAVVINDGTFYGGWRFNGETTTTKIYGGIFTVGFDGQSFHANSTHVVTVYGGTFTAGTKLAGKLENIVADGYKAVESNSNYVVVPESVDAAVSTPAELTTELQKAAAAGAGDSTIVLAGDIDLTGTTWTPISVDGYHGAGVVTIEGNGATIKGLNAPLFAGGFAGKSGIVIKNLTIADSNIVGGNQGGGAFIDCADSMHVITLDNCHLVNSTVSGERAGGLIGWCSGYAKLNDGPVKAYVTITNCSVVDSTVIGNGSAGGIAGHPGASDYTYTTIENCVVKNVDVVSYEPVSSWRTGAIVGTANNGHVVINNVTVENVTLTQDGVTATETKLFGRFVPSGTGTLVIDGAEVVATTEALKEALSAETESIAVILANDISIDISTGWKMGGANTESITIDGNGKVLTLSNTYRSYFNLANAEGVLNLKNMTLTNTHKGTHFFDYTTHFNCDVVAENVVFAKSPLVSGVAKAVFTNCEFSQAGTDIYGLWIMSGSDVTVNGGELKTDRGFKIADEDSAKELTTLKVSDTKFNNTKKAAILVTTNYGATITLENLDITNCTADSTNAVWVDDGRTATFDEIKVTGGTKVIEH